MASTKAFALVLLVTGMVGMSLSSASARVLDREPGMGALKPGERVLVNDGSCGPGKIKEVVGGNHDKVGGTPGSKTFRKKRCIPR